MTQTITATFEDGVLKPTQPLDLPEHTQVQITIEPSKSNLQKEWEATKAERLAALESLLRMAKVHSTEPHLTREQLHERR
jgi:predicted DNA-binding antitoxin AbrB/MazE fold protein